MDMFFLLLVLSSFISRATCDYQCVCNHHTQRGIFGSTSLNSPPLGFLYKDECKAFVWLPNLDKQWVAVQFYHTIAYIQTDSKVDKVLCKGSIPEEDRATTMFPPATFKPGQSSSTATTSLSTVTFPVPTGQYSWKTTKQPIFSNSVTTGQFDPKTTFGIHLTSTPSTSPTTQIPSYATRKPSQKPATTSKTKPNEVHTTIKATNTPVLKGHTELCPSNVRHGAFINGFLLAQYGQSCFEVCNQAVSWYHAANMCKARGGHLLSLNNRAENNYVHTFINNHFHDKTFWIGLNDIQHEQHFVWNSGEHATFRNWESDRNTLNHAREDCAVMLSNGKWDDRDCGSTLVFTEQLYTHFPYVCEYGMHTGNVLIG